ENNISIHFLDDKYYESDDYIIAGIADTSLDSFAAYPAFTDEKPVIMLAHEPQYISLYQSLGADLVLTGHYHGGQIIIPGVGGLVSPEFEFLPDYYEGMRSFGDMTVILSRGLGNSLLPVRINDYPEVVVVKVH
ncbi:MAG: metallophosphoesterase, partial [Lachnospiraceae bacterium]|nr:metallophosphoesterase [Lachnospiraceae bacterium]